MDGDAEVVTIGPFRFDLALKGGGEVASALQDLIDRRMERFEAVIGEAVRLELKAMLPGIEVNVTGVSEEE